MKKILLHLTLICTIAGILAVPARSVQAAAPYALARDLVITNDNNQLVIYTGSGWAHTEDLPGLVNEDEHASAVTSDYAQFRFYGRVITLVSSTGPNSGNADVYIDTVLDTTVDLYSADAAPQQAVYSKSGLTLAYHTIKVVVKGTKNGSSGGYDINIDAFRYEDAAVEAPPATNEIQCYSPQWDPNTTTCTQVSTQHITLVGNLEDPHWDPRWQLLSGGIGTIYARLTTIAVKWTTTPWSGSGNVQFRFDVRKGGGAGYITQSAGTFWPNATRTRTLSAMTAQETVTAAGVYESLTQAYAIPDPGSPHFVSWTTYVLELQTVPFANECIQQYTILTTAGPYVIDPTVETPQGPEGVPADEQIFPITEGYQYIIRVGGDAWHDGSAADVWSSSYSWDGITWYDPLDAPCVTEADGYYKYSAVTDPAPPGATQFYIRAGDDAGDFGDNYEDANENFIYTISYVIFTGLMSCDSQFAYDPGTDLVASVTVPANTAYTLGDDQLTHGEWYVIEIASGSWQDDGAGAARYDAQFSWGDLASTGGPTISAYWTDIGAEGADVYCETEDGSYSTIYTQAQGYLAGEGEANVYLRVADDAETWTANTGSLTINIYAAEFTRRETTCELTYGVEGFIGTSEIPANAENGVMVAFSTSLVNASFGDMRLNPGAWYMLETRSGPWGWVGSTHSDMSYDLQVQWGGDWVPLENWAAATCVAATDSLGHLRVYFQAPSTGSAEYKFRVADTASWSNNIGLMDLDLYGAYDQEVSLEDGTCDYIYDGDNPVQGPAPIVVQATDADGEYIGNILTAGNIYAFVFEGSDYYWTEASGGDHLYAMQISPDNGASWYDAPNGYGGILCYFQNGSDTIIFIKAGFNYMYRFRVDSETFTNNTGSMGINIYAASMGDSIDPWQNCLEGAALSPIVSFEWIDVYREEGETLTIQAIQNGIGDPTEIDVLQKYSEDPSVIGFVVTLLEGPWRDGETEQQHYDAQLSSDNGTTWGDFDKANPDLFCADWAEPVFLKQLKFAFFGFEAGQVWKIRVNDEDTDTFDDNTGNLAFALYAVTGPTTVPDCLVETNNPECIPWDQIPSGVLINGVDICSAMIPTPQAPTTIDVPEWLNYVASWIPYGGAMIMQYGAWCPKHTDALRALLDVFKSRDPIASLLEIQQVMTLIQTQAAAYNWSDTDAEASPIFAVASGGQSSSSVMERLFPNVNSAWNGGPLINGLQSWSGGSEFASCVANYTEFVNNDGLTGGVCFVAAAAKSSGFSFLLQLMLDLSIALFVFFDFYRQIKNVAEFMAGNRTEAGS